MLLTNSTRFETDKVTITNMNIFCKEICHLLNNLWFCIDQHA
jgi:hypothetical protein